jgi:hypothetical protein
MVKDVCIRPLPTKISDLKHWLCETIASVEQELLQEKFAVGFFHHLHFRITTGTHFGCVTFS